MKNTAPAKLVFYSHEYPPVPGGIGEATFNIFSHFHFNSKQVLTSHYLDTDYIYPTSEEQVIRFKTRRNGIREYWSGLKCLFQVARKERNTVFLAWDTFSQRNCWLLSFVMPIKYHNICIGSEILTNHSVKGWIKLRGVYKRSQSNIPISNYVGDILEKHNVPRIDRRFHLGIRQHFFEQERDKSLITRLQSIYKTSGKTVIVSISRLDIRKGHDVIIDALSRFDKGKLNKIRYLIVGGGKEEQRLRQMVTDRHLEEVVEFTGHVSEEEKIALLDLADIYVLASRQQGDMIEGLGLSYIEAMARGTPAIGGNHGGVAEVIEDGKTGFLVDPLSPADFHEVLGKLLEDEELREILSKNGQEAMYNRFNLAGASNSLRDIVLGG